MRAAFKINHNAKHRILLRLKLFVGFTIISLRVRTTDCEATILRNA